MARLDLYFDFLSPYTYLASTQLDGIARRTGAQLTYTPFHILDLMQLVGNRPTTFESANKRRYAGQDMLRWAARYGVTVNSHPRARKFDFSLLRQAALVANDLGRPGAFVHGVFKGLWGLGLDLEDEDVLVGLLDGIGFDGAALLEAARDPQYAEQLKANTAEAASRGVFGSPTFFVGDEMFFGNDRLNFVEDTLLRALGATPELDHE
jgi:2-hydroxychromene-2-carboxylate isomerase